MSGSQVLVFPRSWWGCSLLASVYQTSVDIPEIDVLGETSTGLRFPSWKILTLQLYFCAKLLPLEPGGVCFPLVGGVGYYSLHYQNTFSLINQVTSGESACVLVFNRPHTG